MCVCAERHVVRVSRSNKRIKLLRAFESGEWLCMCRTVVNFLIISLPTGPALRHPLNVFDRMIRVDGDALDATKYFFANLFDPSRNFERQNGIVSAGDTFYGVLSS